MARQSGAVSDHEVVYFLRDLNKDLIDAWQQVFVDYPDIFKISKGHIFEGAPAVDAVVSPANSFGFMDGGIDLVYTKHFGVKLPEQLRKVIEDEFDKEILVGQAAIIPAYPTGHTPSSEQLVGCNEGIPIKFLISAPVMRVPMDVSDTMNAYLSFRGVILAVRKHNADKKNTPIRSVLVPGLGTGIGKITPQRCSYQMLQAYETYVSPPDFS